MREHLDRLAAEHDCGDAAPAMRGHDNEVAAFRARGSDDRPIGVFILDLDCLAGTPAACAAWTTVPSVFSACFCMRASY
jgi:hypothetical protein